MLVRVCHVGNVSPNVANGVVEATARLVEYLPTLGVDCEVWNFSRSVKQPTHSHVRGLSRWQLPVIGPRHAVGAHLQVLAPSTLGWLRERKTYIDVVHMHSVFQPDHIWASHLSVPYIVTPHGGLAPHQLARKRFGKSAWRKLFERSLLERAAFVQALTETELTEIHSVAVEARAICLPIPMSAELLQRSEKPYSADGPILSLGRLDVHEKGLDLLLAILGQIDRNLLRRGVILAGPGTERELRHLRELISAFELDHCVTVIGPVFGESKFRLIESASLVIQLSRSEGMPLVPLEAMALGVPIIVSPACRLNDVVTWSGGGWIVEPSGIDAAARIMKVLDLAARERAERGASGRSWISSNLSWESLGSKYLAMYQLALLQHD